MKACVFISDNDSQQQLNSGSLISPSGHRISESKGIDQIKALLQNVHPNICNQTMVCCGIKVNKMI